MPIPTEPVGSIPRPQELIEGIRDFASGRLSGEKLNSLYDRAIRDTIQRFEATGSPVITDGEQTKPSFATYRVLDRFSPEERKRIGVHTCPGGDRDSTHSADVDYAELLPGLFNFKVTNFYIQLASERDRRRVLGIIKAHAKSNQRIFVGVIDPNKSEGRDSRRGERPGSRSR